MIIWKLWKVCELISFRLQSENSFKRKLPETQIDSKESKSID